VWRVFGDDVFVLVAVELGFECALCLLLLLGFLQQLFSFSLSFIVLIPLLDRQ
jgi:uncharacterized membrane protein YphA (DoxX/SURF4 family)